MTTLFNEHHLNSIRKIDTSMSTAIGYFGVSLLEHGASYIGAEIWEKHGLTQEDKKDFEAYQNGCEILNEAYPDDPIWKTDLLDKVEKYERSTSEDKRATIVKIIMEIDVFYEIGNWKSQIFESVCDDDSTPDAEYLRERRERYAEWRRIKMNQLDAKEETEEERRWMTQEELENFYENTKGSEDESRWMTQEELENFCENTKGSEEERREMTQEELENFDYEHYAYSEEEDWCEKYKYINAQNREDCYEQMSREDREEYEEDLYEREREIRYSMAIDNMRDDGYDSC